ncbi:MAG: hypothetical protein OXG11_03955, partial [Chloroflexi bacterium]|nr:hypothetical protein [Chloroflexota bacterium]
MSYLHALPTIFVLHLRNSGSPWMFLGGTLSIAPLIAVVTWIATQSLDSKPIAYISIGVILMAMWQTCVFLSGWSLSGEFDLGTADYTMVSRTPLRVVMLTKSVATLALAIPNAVFVFATVQLISRELIHVERPFFLLISIAV